MFKSVKKNEKYNCLQINLTINMDILCKTKNIFLNRLKYQIWCDLVIGRSDNNKVQWSDENIQKYINNIEDLLHKCVEQIIKEEEDLDNVPDDGIREYLYDYCDTFYDLEHEKDQFDKDKYDWNRNPMFR